jgi:hypothetical protein
MIPPIYKDTLYSPSPTDIKILIFLSKKKGKTTTIDVMLIVTMPGLADPVVKTTQCTVESES